MDYSRTSYQIWLLIRFNDNVFDKAHRLCYSVHLCQFPQPKTYRQLNNEFDKEFYNIDLNKKNELIIPSFQQNMPNYDYYF